MSFEFLGDNFGREFPEPLGVGLEAIEQPRTVGDDLFIVRDPEVESAWIVSDTTVEATK